MGVLITFSLKKKKKSHIHWPIINFFWNIGLSLMKAPLWTQLQNTDKCIPTWPSFSVYIHGSWTLGRPYGVKPRCYWEHLGDSILEHFGNMMGTRHRSDIWNTSISQRCSKRSIFKYLKKIIIKIQRLENWPLYKLF